MHIRHNLAMGTMATEAISHQDTKFFNELADAIRPMMNVPAKLQNQALLDRCGLEKILKDRFKAEFTVTLDPAMYPNAWVMPPYFDGSHVLSNIPEYWNSPGLTKFFIEQQKKAFKDGKFLRGTVDREKAVLGGDFSKFLCPITITAGMIGHPQSTAEIVADILLHEVGHFFTYFEHLGRQDTFNGALLASAENFFKKDKAVDRIKVVADIGDMVHLEADDKEALMMAKDKEQFILVIARSYVRPRDSTLGSSIYDMTMWESMSDQFATRMGGGKHGVATMALFGGNTGGMLSHMIMTMFRVLMFSVLTVMTGGLALLILFVNPAEKIYDAPRARMDRIRNDMVAGLKSSTLTAKQKQVLTDDIAEADKILEKFKDYRGLIEFFYTSILPSGRRQYTQLQFQRELEKLTANNLLLASAKLNNFSTKFS